MATIKTQLTNNVRRVITKVVNGQRRVSCSCCEEEVECCMYPASALGNGTITFEDLPEEIVASISGFVIPKVSSPIFVSDEIGTITIYYGSVGEGYGIDAENPNVWSYKIDFVINPFDSCLFNTGSVFTDNFAYTYTLSDGFETFVVTRTNLCTWEGDSGVLYYTGGGFDAIGQGTLKWYSTFIEQNGPKQSGFQNTPIGTYQDPVSLGTWTVS